MRLFKDELGRPCYADVCFSQYVIRQRNDLDSSDVRNLVQFMQDFIYPAVLLFRHTGELNKWRDNFNGSGFRNDTAKFVHTPMSEWGDLTDDVPTFNYAILTGESTTKEREKILEAVKAMDKLIEE